MSRPKFGLHQVNDLIAVREAFTHAGNTVIGVSLHDAVRKNRLYEGMQMVKEQIALGNEWGIIQEIGRSGIEAINRLLKS